MDGLYKPVAVAVIFAFFVAWAWRILNWVWVRPRKLEKCLRKQGLQGNSYRLLFGDIKEDFMMIKAAKSKPIDPSADIVPRVIPFVHQTIKNYGKSCFIWIGPTPRVQLMDPEIIKGVFIKNYKFPKPELNPIIKLFADGLANYEGEQWAKHRRLLNPAFHLEKLKHMLPVIHISCREMVMKWQNMISANGSCELDVWPFLQTLTRDVISRTAFGSSYEEGSMVFELQSEQAELILKSVRSLYIPGFRYLPSKSNKRIKEIDRRIQSLLMNIINKKMKAIKARKTSTDDLLGILLESNSSEVQDGNKNVGMSIQEVIGECKLFYFAGQETTSVLLVWTMILLCIHPDWQARAREEVLQVFGNSKPEFDNLNQLKIVTMIFYEILRLYPPVVMLNRVVHEETKLGEIILPAGVQLSVPIMLLHHDCEIWGDDAKEFKPERFSEGVSKATKNEVVFLPFGWGPRICIGQNFAMLEAKLALAIVLQHFSFELSPSYTHAPTPVITVQPQYGANLILHKL